MMEKACGRAESEAEPMSIVLYLLVVTITLGGSQPRGRSDVVSSRISALRPTGLNIGDVLFNPSYFALSLDAATHAGHRLPVIHSAGGRDQNIDASCEDALRDVATTF
jgi:hypothetical protein